MKSRFCVLICCVLFSAAAWAASQPSMMVVVVNAHTDPAQPVPGVRVSLTYVDGSSTITVSRDATGSRGEALLLLTAEAQERGDLCLEISGAPELVIYQPAGGVLPGTTAKVTIQLLPKGSPLLKGPAQIEAMLYRYSQRIHKLESEIAQAQPSRLPPPPPKPDFARDLREWAVANGFSYEEVDREVRSWAEGIQKLKDQATLRQKMLAELAQRNYDAVIQLAGEGMDATAHDLDAEEHAFLEKQRKTLQDYLSLASAQANAYQLKLQFHTATEVLEKARDRAGREHQHFPEDAALRAMWLDALEKAADAREQEGEAGAASESLSLLARSADDYRVLLQQHAGPEERVDWARAQQALGNVLVRAGERKSGEESLKLLDDGVQTYRSALEVYSRKDWPQEWARVETNLGIALLREGENSKGEKALAFLNQAVEALRSALEVCSRADQPRIWAAAQVGLGITLLSVGDSASDEKALDMLSESVRALQQSLDVFTKAETPQQWARTQMDLGIVLTHEGWHASDDRALELFQQAVEAYERALEVRTKEALPQDWAITQVNLGATLGEAGRRARGERSLAFFDRAAQAFQSALTIYTKSALPRAWAVTQRNLGRTLTDEGNRAAGERAVALFQQAVQAYLAAMEVAPNDPNALAHVIALYHDKLYDYTRAYEAGELLLKSEPSADNRLTLEEVSLTAGHFVGCLDQGALIGDGDVEADSRLVRDVLKLACQWGAGSKAEAQQTRAALLSRKMELQPGTWTFGGTRHFLATAPVFEAGRASWDKLFESLEKGDAAGMADALHKLGEIMKD